VSPPDVAVRATAIVAQLATTFGSAHVFLGEVRAVMDADGRAHPYAALYPTAGNLSSLDLAGNHDVFDWPFQVTVAGGDPARALRAISRCRSALTGHTLVVDGDVVGRIVEEPDYQPGPLREDTDARPSRWYSPLLFRLLPDNA
jgi:hypothetical protein